MAIASVPYKRVDSREKAKKQKNLLQKILPLSWDLWPSEARLLIGLAALWSMAGLVILASASWWVASREMGDGAFYVKRQMVWLLASWVLLGISINTDIRRWLKWAGPILWTFCLLIAATLIAGTTVNGASRWLMLGPFQIQPSELIKP